MTTTVWSTQVSRTNGIAQSPDHDGGVPASLLPDQHELLQLLANGLSDQAIGRRLGLSRRTVQRRVRSLMDHYAVQTRFQLGMRAAGQLTILS